MAWNSAVFDRICRAGRDLGRETTFMIVCSLRKGTPLQQLVSAVLDHLSGSFGILLWYLVGLNLLTFILMWLDLVRAKNRVFRTPPAVFVTLSLMGGSIGNLIGLLCFRLRSATLTLRFLLAMILIPLAQAAFVLTIFASGQISFL